MSINIQDGLFVSGPKPVEDKYLNNGAVWADTAEVLSTLPVQARYQGLTVLITATPEPIEYWFRDGITDGDLVVKQADAGLNTSGSEDNQVLLSTGDGSPTEFGWADRLQSIRVGDGQYRMWYGTRAQYEALSDADKDRTDVIHRLLDVGASGLPLEQGTDITIQGLDYASINSATQVLTLGQIDLATDVTGSLPNTHVVGFDTLNAAVDLNTAHRGSTSNPHGVTADQIGLGNVDNTSDLLKPISTAAQTAIDLKADQTDLDTTDAAVTLNTAKIGLPAEPTDDGVRILRQTVEAGEDTTTEWVLESEISPDLTQEEIETAITDDAAFRTAIGAKPATIHLPATDTPIAPGQIAFIDANHQYLNISTDTTHMVNSGTDFTEAPFSTSFLQFGKDLAGLGVTKTAAEINALESGTIIRTVSSIPGGVTQLTAAPYYDALLPDGTVNPTPTDQVEVGDYIYHLPDPLPTTVDDSVTNIGLWRFTEVSTGIYVWIHPARGFLWNANQLYVTGQTIAHVINGVFTAYTATEGTFAGVENRNIEPGVHVDWADFWTRDTSFISSDLQHWENALHVVDGTRVEVTNVGEYNHADDDPDEAWVQDEPVIFSKRADGNATNPLTPDDTATLDRVIDITRQSLDNVLDFPLAAATPWVVGRWYQLGTTLGFRRTAGALAVGEVSLPASTNEDWVIITPPQIVLNEGLGFEQQEVDFGGPAGAVTVSDAADDDFAMADLTAAAVAAPDGWAIEGGGTASIEADGGALTALQSIGLHITNNTGEFFRFDGLQFDITVTSAMTGGSPSLRWNANGSPNTGQFGLGAGADNVLRNVGTHTVTFAPDFLRGQGLPNEGELYIATDHQGAARDGLAYSIDNIVLIGGTSNALRVDFGTGENQVPRGNSVPATGTVPASWDDIGTGGGGTASGLALNAFVDEGRGFASFRIGSTLDVRYATSAAGANQTDTIPESSPFWIGANIDATGNTWTEVPEELTGLPTQIGNLLEPANQAAFDALTPIVGNRMRPVVNVTGAGASPTGGFFIDAVPSVTVAQTSGTGGDNRTWPETGTLQTGENFILTDNAVVSSDTDGATGFRLTNNGGDFTIPTGAVVTITMRVDPGPSPSQLGGPQMVMWGYNAAGVQQWQQVGTAQVVGTAAADYTWTITQAADQVVPAGGTLRFAFAHGGNQALNMTWDMNEFNMDFAGGTYDPTPVAGTTYTAGVTYRFDTDWEDLFPTTWRGSMQNTGILRTTSFGTTTPAGNVEFDGTQLTL